jgi:hypothetical protein
VVTRTLLLALCIPLPWFGQINLPAVTTGVPISETWTVTPGYTVTQYTLVQRNTSAGATTEIIPASSIIVRMSAIRKLAVEAMDSQLLSTVLSPHLETVARTLNRRVRLPRPSIWNKKARSPSRGTSPTPAPSLPITPISAADRIPSR